MAVKNAASEAPTPKTGVLQLASTTNHWLAWAIGQPHCEKPLAEPGRLHGGGDVWGECPCVVGMLTGSNLEKAQRGSGKSQSEGLEEWERMAGAWRKCRLGDGDDDWPKSACLFSDGQASRDFLCWKNLKWFQPRLSSPVTNKGPAVVRCSKQPQSWVCRAADMYSISCDEAPLKKATALG